MNAIDARDDLHLTAIFIIINVKCKLGLVLKQAQLLNADIYSNSYNAESYCMDSDLRLLIKQPIGATHDLEIDSGAYFRGEEITCSLRNLQILR